MTKKNQLKIMFNAVYLVKMLGLGLMFAALLMVAMRSFTIEMFENSKHKSFMAPAGKMLAHETQNFSFAAVSDTGARTESVERIMNQIRKSRASFVLYVGDLVRYRNPSHFKWMAEEIDEKLGKTPLYAVPGNHEILSVDGEIDRSLYHELFGPSYYWFGYGEVLFIGLDTSTSTIGEEQLKWLKRTLVKIRPQFKYCIIFTHVPPINLKTANDHRLYDDSRNKLAAVIKNKGVDLMISGHVHFFSETEFAGVPLVTLPSSGQPIRSEVKKFGYVMFKISPDGVVKIRQEYVSTGDDVEFFEYFISNALVKDEINDVSSWIFGFGFVLFVLGFVLKNKQ